jgi:hypothetical protein
MNDLSDLFYRFQGKCFDFFSHPNDFLELFRRQFALNKVHLMPFSIDGIGGNPVHFRNLCVGQAFIPSEALQFLPRDEIKRNRRGSSLLSRVRYWIHVHEQSPSLTFCIIFPNFTHDYARDYSPLYSLLH